MYKKYKYFQTLTLIHNTSYTCIYLQWYFKKISIHMVSIIRFKKTVKKKKQNTTLNYSSKK